MANPCPERLLIKFAERANPGYRNQAVAALEYRPLFASGRGLKPFTQKFLDVGPRYRLLFASGRGLKQICKRGGEKQVHLDALELCQRIARSRERARIETSSASVSKPPRDAVSPALASGRGLKHNEGRRSHQPNRTTVSPALRGGRE